MKLRSSTKIAIGFAIIAGGGIFGYQYFMRRAIMSEHFSQVVPGTVNLVGINTGSGFKIIVANQMAQLVEASDNFAATESEGGGATEGAIKKRVPISEMLAVLRGDQSKLGPFIMKVDDRDENDSWPPRRIVWTQEQLMQAFNGDKKLEAKLVHDLNINLDGTPLPILDRDSMENGIIIDYAVPVKVMVGGVQKTLIGRVQEPFKADMLTNVEKQLADKKIDNNMMAGYYAEASRAILSGKNHRQDVKKAIMLRFSPQNLRDLAKDPERILQSAVVVVNENYIKSATYHSYETTNGQMNDLTIEMTDEGRRRLWQFSEDRIGTQLLLIVNGVADAAPRISHELAQGELTITQMPDETLVKEAVAALNKHDKGPS